MMFFRLRENVYIAASSIYIGSYTLKGLGNIGLYPDSMTPTPNLTLYCIAPDLPTDTPPPTVYSLTLLTNTSPYSSTPLVCLLYPPLFYTPHPYPYLLTALSSAIYQGARRNYPPSVTIHLNTKPLKLLNFNV
jgi:hypothetical protein